jgi:hypothetical protein
MSGFRDGLRGGDWSPASGGGRFGGAASSGSFRGGLRGGDFRGGLARAASQDGRAVRGFRSGAADFRKGLVDRRRDALSKGFARFDRFHHRRFKRAFVVVGEGFDNGFFDSGFDNGPDYFNDNICWVAHYTWQGTRYRYVCGVLGSGYY